MFITSHSQVLKRQWRTMGGGFGPIQERRAWAGQRFECGVELRGVATDASGTGEWRWSYVRAYVGPESEPEVLPNRTYARCRFRRENVTLDEFLARAQQCQLSTVGSERQGQRREPHPFRIGDLEIPARLDQGWDYMSETSESRHCHWPCWAVVSPLTCEGVWDPLVSSRSNHPLF